MQPCAHPLAAGTPRSNCPQYPLACSPARKPASQRLYCCHRCLIKHKPMIAWSHPLLCRFHPARRTLHPVRQTGAAFPAWQTATAAGVLANAGIAAGRFRYFHQRYCKVMATPTTAAAFMAGIAAPSWYWKPGAPCGPVWQRTAFCCRPQLWRRADRVAAGAGARQFPPCSAARSGIVSPVMIGVMALSDGRPEQAQHPGAKARSRRSHWRIVPLFYASLHHGMFRGWTAAALQAYVDYAFERQRRRRCRTQMPPRPRGRIFGLVPAPAVGLAGRVQTPVKIDYGDQLPVCCRIGQTLAGINPQIGSEQVPGSHCFMQQDPAAAAARIGRFHRWADPPQPASHDQRRMLVSRRPPKLRIRTAPPAGSARTHRFPQSFHSIDAAK